MQFQPRPSDYHELLEVFRFGLIHGLISKEQVIIWADNIIQAATQPDYFFIEISLAKDKNTLLELIRQEPGVTDNIITIRVLLGLLYNKYADPGIPISEFGAMFPMLDALNNCEIVSGIESGTIYELSNGYDEAVSPDSAELIRSDVLKFLAIYREFNIANYRSWAEINARIQPLFDHVKEQIIIEHKDAIKTKRKGWLKTFAKSILTFGILLVLIAIIAIAPSFDTQLGRATSFKYSIPILLIIVILVRIGRAYVDGDQSSFLMTKDILRAKYLTKRHELPINKYDKLNEGLVLRFQELDLTGIKTIHLFLPIVENNEPNTYLIRDWLKENQPHVKVVHPKANFGTITMRSYAYDADLRIETSRYGIPEPVSGNEVDIKEIDLVILPMLVFDEQGYRVGYGKGFYDRFCAQCKTGTQFIGLSLFEPIKSIEDVNQYDVWMHVCVTPDKIWRWH